MAETLAMSSSSEAFTQVLHLREYGGTCRVVGIAMIRSARRGLIAHGVCMILENCMGYVN